MGIGIWKFLHNGIAHGLFMSHPFQDPKWVLRFHNWSSDGWIAAEKVAKAKRLTLADIRNIGEPEPNPLAYVQGLPVEVLEAHRVKAVANVSFLERAAQLGRREEDQLPFDIEDQQTERESSSPKREHPRTDNFSGFLIREKGDRRNTAAIRAEREKFAEAASNFNSKLLAPAFADEGRIPGYTRYGVDDDGSIYLEFTAHVDARKFAAWYDTLRRVRYDTDEIVLPHAARVFENTVYVDSVFISDELNLDTPHGYPMD